VKEINMKTTLLWATLIVIGVVLGGCQSDQQTSKETEQLPAQKVVTTVAQLKPVSNQIELLGTVESVYKAEIAARVSGTITTLPVVLGSEVHKDDLLVEISAGEIDAKLQQSRAQMEQARRNLEREKKLLTKSAATPETVKSLEEYLSIAEAAYQEARTIQSYTRVLSPFDGRVTSKQANIGDLATPGKPLLNIEDENHLQVITDIPEAMILQVKQGDVFSIHIPAANLTISGTVAEVAPTANPTTRSGPVKLNIDAHPDLRPGQFARVALALQETTTLVVPAEAIIPLGQMDRIYVVEKDHARLRLVRPGASYGEQIEILSGIQPGDAVIIEGQQTLHDGQPVIIQ
jgi:RND family efflux transporter MFP subunit